MAGQHSTGTARAVWNPGAVAQRNESVPRCTGPRGRAYLLSGLVGRRAAKGGSPGLARTGVDRLMRRRTRSPRAGRGGATQRDANDIKHVRAGMRTALGPTGHCGRKEGGQRTRARPPRSNIKAEVSRAPAQAGRSAERNRQNDRDMI